MSNLSAPGESPLPPPPLQTIPRLRHPPLSLSLGSSYDHQECYSVVIFTLHVIVIVVSVQTSYLKGLVCTQLPCWLTGSTYVIICQNNFFLTHSIFNFSVARHTCTSYTLTNFFLPFAVPRLHHNMLTIVRCQSFSATQLASLDALWILFFIPFTKCLKWYFIRNFVSTFSTRYALFTI